MNLSHDQLRAFYQVARLSSFTKAAEFLGFTQSALSHRIKNLERELETSLFIRSATGLKLTDTGNKLLKYVQVQGQIEEEFINDLKTGRVHELGGLIRIGGASTLMWSVVTPALAGLIRKRDIRFEFLVRELSALPHLLQTGEVDMIITCGQPGMYQYEEIKLGEEINVLVESKKYSDISEIFLDYNSQDLTTIRYLKLHDKKAEKLQRNFANDIHGIIAGVEAGLGRAILPLHLLKGHKGVQIVEGERKLRQPVFLCHLKQPFYTRLQSAVIETLQKEVPRFLHLDLD